MTDTQTGPATVWVAMDHFPYEGAALIGVFTDEATARAACEADHDPDEPLSEWSDGEALVGAVQRGATLGTADRLILTDYWKKYTVKEHPVLEPPANYMRT